ncbi:putative Amylovoran biosynthesis glycosyltransferase AmsB [Vibrio chagasii]|nr:putative Amylovoran biosynthesis glycosyltransferase AmsB [Vibrio chagasii]CAH7415445.1 putative Amylovoran biosynthesis glycosyltransferase AmsB [Vibrio chagasii]CAH7424512.1 putative Amylovoran biosynthesis glycosyltransferase AmsB [Vibrio chagasii]
MFSIIIPTYNSSSYISKALDSILCQSIDVELIEVIIIDDNSSDFGRLAKVVRCFEEKITIRLISNNKKGNASVSRNIGLNQAKNDIICLLDADDYWSPNKLEAGEKLLKEKCVVYTRLKRGTYKQLDNNEYSLIPKHLKSEKESLGEYWFENKGVTQTSSLMYRKQDFPNICFNEKLKRHQDYDFCLQLENNDAKFVFDEFSLTYWVILDQDINAVTKGADLDFCINWLEEYSIYLKEKSRNYYIGKNMFIIAIKDRSITKWISYLSKLSFKRRCEIVKITTKVIFEKVTSKVLSRCR